MTMSFLRSLLKKKHSRTLFVSNWEQKLSKFTRSTILIFINVLWGQVRYLLRIVVIFCNLLLFYINCLKYYYYLCLAKREFTGKEKYHMK